MNPLRHGGMRKNPRVRHRVLAIDPAHWGLGFVVFESSGLLVEWGTREADSSGRNDRCVASAHKLITEYRPTIVALEDWTAPSSHRRARVRRLLARLHADALRRGVKTALIAPLMVRRRLGLDLRATKHQIASALAAQFPEIESLLPPPRKLWQNEHPRMSIFTALALAVSAVESGRPRGP